MCDFTLYDTIALKPFEGNWMRKTFIVIGFVLVLVAAILFWSIRSSARANVLWEAVENEVSVTVEVVRRPAGQLEMLAKFTPTREHFHLYSKDLPKNGVDGLGRPTLIEVVSPFGAIRPTGALTADQPTHDLHFESLGLIFPVYPEGIVTLRLPFEFTGTDGADSVELSVTYMTCSDQVCLAPVIDRRFTVNIPRNP